MPISSSSLKKTIKRPGADESTVLPIDRVVGNFGE